MTWCDTCSEYADVESAEESGLCPTCSEPLGSTAEHLHDDDLRVGDSAPWHFWLVVVALAGYLLWRLIEFFAWALG